MDSDSLDKLWTFRKMCFRREISTHISGQTGQNTLGGQNIQTQYKYTLKHSWIKNKCNCNKNVFYCLILHLAYETQFSMTSYSEDTIYGERNVHFNFSLYVLKEDLLSKRIERKLLGTFSPILNTKHPQLKPLDHLLTVFLLSAFLPQFATIHFKGKHQLAKLWNK